MNIDWQEIVIRLVLAAIFGAAIGLERERKNWAAGMRTHMMVCLGSALAMLVSTYGFNDVLNVEGIGLDPSRIAAQVISGIGFIGAGTIMFLSKGVIRGLTTAAGLWTVAAIGLATGSGMYLAALITTVLAIVILFILQPLEKKFAYQFGTNQKLSIKVANKGTLIQLLESVIDKDKFGISDFFIQLDENDLMTVDIYFEHTSKKMIPELINQLKINCDIKEINWNE